MFDSPVIGLVGFAGAGKDSVADVLCGRHAFARVAFADPLREMASALNPYIATGGLPGRGDDGLVRYADALRHFGYTDAKVRYAEVRAFLQRLGTDAGRAVLGDDIWVRTAVANARALLTDHEGVAFTDVRFQNEADAVREMGGVVVRVERPGVGAVNDHVSERFAAEGEVDATVLNDGTLGDLARKADDLLTWISEREVEPFDDDGYPTDAALARVRSWSYKDIPGWLAYCRSLWRYADGKSPAVREDGREWQFHTFGWSGNESVARAMHENTMCWTLTWRRMDRGGHYWFEVPAYQAEASE